MRWAGRFASRTKRRSEKKCDISDSSTEGIMLEPCWRKIASRETCFAECKHVNLSAIRSRYGVRRGNYPIFGNLVERLAERQTFILARAKQTLTTKATKVHEGRHRDEKPSLLATVQRREARATLRYFGYAKGVKTICYNSVTSRRFIGN